MPFFVDGYPPATKSTSPSEFSGARLREIINFRRIEHPRHRVFEAFSDPDQLARWRVADPGE